MSKDLGRLDKKIRQAMTLTKELKDLQQSITLKQGLINDVVQDIMVADLGFNPEAQFSLIEVMQKIRDASDSSNLIVSP